MFLAPLIVSLGILAIAYLLFRVLPEIIDFDRSFLWVIGGFLVLYIGAAVYVSHSLPALSQTFHGDFTEYVTE